MFDFRIIPCADGTDIIDTNLKTPYESLTPSQMVDYTEMEKQLVYMKRMKERERKKEEREQKIAQNPLYKLAYVCGIV